MFQKLAGYFMVNLALQLLNKDTKTLDLEYLSSPVTENVCYE